MAEHGLVPAERIERAILVLRGHRVILDRELATLYGVTTGNLNKAVSRNLDRFPDDFMFQLSPDEMGNLIFHFGASSWGGTRKPPRAFTEQGVAMLSSVLRSPRAAHVNIEIMRAFVRLRQMLQSNADLARKLAALEQKYDTQFKAVFDAIRAGWCQRPAEGEAEPRPLSGGLHVPAHPGGSQSSEVTICDLKFLGRSPVLALRGLAFLRLFVGRSCWWMRPLERCALTGMC